MQNINAQLSQLYKQLNMWLKTAPRCHQLGLKSTLACENTAGAINAKLASAVVRQQDGDMQVSPLNNFYAWAESSIEIGNRGDHGDHANLLAESFFSPDTSRDSAALGVCQIETSRDAPVHDDPEQVDPRRNDPDQDDPDRDDPDRDDPDQDDLGRDDPEQIGAENSTKTSKQQLTTNQDPFNKLCFQLYGFDPDLILSQPPLASTIDLIDALSSEQLILTNCSYADLSAPSPSMAPQLFATSEHPQADLFTQAPVILQVCAQLLEHLISKGKRVLVLTPADTRAQLLVSLLDPELQKLCFRGGQEFLYESLSKAHNLFKYVFCTPRKAFNIRGLSSIERTMANQSARLQKLLAMLAWLIHRETQLYSFHGRNIALSELIKWTCDNQQSYQQLLPPISKPQLKFPLAKHDLQQLYELNQVPTSTSEKIQEYLLQQPLDYFAVPTQDIIRLLQNLQSTGQHLQELTHQLALMQQELKLAWRWSLRPDGLCLTRSNQPQSQELIPWSCFSSNQLSALSQLALSKGFDPVWYNIEPQHWSVFLLAYNHWQQQALDHSDHYQLPALTTSASSATSSASANSVAQVTADSTGATLSTDAALSAADISTTADTDLGSAESDLTPLTPEVPPNPDTESTAWYSPQNTTQIYQRLQLLVAAVNNLCQNSQACLLAESGFTPAQHQPDCRQLKLSLNQHPLELALSTEPQLKIDPQPSLAQNVFAPPQSQPAPLAWAATDYSLPHFPWLDLTFHTQAQDILPAELSCHQTNELTIVSADSSSNPDCAGTISSELSAAASHAEPQSGFKMLFEQQVAKSQAECVADTELDAEASAHVELIGPVVAPEDQAGGAGAVNEQGSAQAPASTELTVCAAHPELGKQAMATAAVSTTAIVHDADQALTAISEPDPTQDLELADASVAAQPALTLAASSATSAISTSGTISPASITTSAAVSTTSVDMGLKNEPCSDQQGILSKLLTPFKAVGAALWGLLCSDGESTEPHDSELKTSAENAQDLHWLDVVKQRQACAQQWDSLLVDMGYAHFYELSTDGMPEFQAQAILRRIQLGLSYAERDLSSVVRALQCMGLRFEFLGRTPDSAECPDRPDRPDRPDSLDSLDNPDSPDSLERPDSSELGLGAAGFLGKVSELKALLTAIHQFLPLACQAIQAQIKFNGLSAQFTHYLMLAQSKAQSFKQAQGAYAQSLSAAYQEVLKLIQRKIQLGDAWLAAYAQINGPEFNQVAAQLQSLEHSLELSINELKKLPELQRSQLLQKLRQVDPLWAQAIQEHQGPHGSCKVPPNLKSAWHWRNLELALRQYTPLLDPLLFCKIHNCLTDLWQQSPQYMRLKVQEISAKLANSLSASDKELVSVLFAQHIDPPDVEGSKQTSLSKRNKLPDETIARRSCHLLKKLPCWIMSWDEFLNQADKTRFFDVILYLDAHKLPVIAGLALRFAQRVVIMGKAPAAQQTAQATKPQPKPAKNGANLKQPTFLLWPEDMPEVAERLKQLDFLVEPSPPNTSAHSDGANPEASPAAQEPSPDMPLPDLNMSSLFEMILDKALLDQQATSNLDAQPDASAPSQLPAADPDIAVDDTGTLADGDNSHVEQHSKLGFVTDVANILRQRGWQVVQPYVAGTYSLNLVVQYQGLKVAIECIGSYLGESQQQAAQLLRRQGFLEQAGWQVIYVFSTLFYSSPLTAIEQVEQALTALGLHYGQEITPEPDTKADESAQAAAEADTDADAETAAEDEIATTAAAVDHVEPEPELAAPQPEAATAVVAEPEPEPATVPEPESAAAPTPPLKPQPASKHRSAMVAEPNQSARSAVPTVPAVPALRMPAISSEQRNFVAAVANSLSQRGWIVMQHDTVNLSVLDVVVPSKNIRILIAGLNSDQSATHLPAELLNLHDVLKSQGWPIFNLGISQFYTTPQATCKKIEQKLNTLGLYPDPEVETESDPDSDSSSTHADASAEYDEPDVTDEPDEPDESVSVTPQIANTQAAPDRQARQPAAAAAVEDILTPEFADPDLYQDPPLLTDIENSKPDQSSAHAQRSVPAQQLHTGHAHAPMHGSPDPSSLAWRLNAAAAASAAKSQPASPAKSPEPSVTVAASKAKSPQTKAQASDFFWHEPQSDPEPKLSKVDKVKLEQDRIHLNRMASEEFNRGLIPHGFVQDSKSQLAHVSSMSQPEHKAFCKYKDELRHIVSQTAKDGVVCVNLIDAQIKLLIYLPKHSADKILLDYEARGLVFAQVKRKADPGFAWYHNLVPCVFVEFEVAMRTRMQARHF